METTKWILKYPNGRFVKRDDSTGPMSSGGYPYPMDDLEDATQWETSEAASKYARNENFTLHRLDISYKISDPLPKIDFWQQCNHRCEVTPLSSAPTAKHYLDCPVWSFAKKNED